MTSAERVVLDASAAIALLRAEPEAAAVARAVALGAGEGAIVVPDAFWLEVENVRIAIGDNVWLRSREANIKLGGEVGMSIARTGAAAPGGETAEVLPALEGSVTADRGTYRLALGPVQRTFEVEQGSLQFFGDADLNPTLDIRATHAVRQALREHLGDVLRNRRLNALVCDLELALGPADLALRPWDRQEVHKVFDALQFRVLRERLAQAVGDGWAPRGVTVSPITGPAGNVEFFLWLTRGDAPPFDVERALAAALARAP